MKKKKPDKENKPFRVEEPKSAYDSGNSEKTIHFFTSFEEMNEYDHREMAKFTPLERLQHITEFIKHAYADELKKKMTELTIYFDK